jgi:aspartate aminotransferase-like enzyme
MQENLLLTPGPTPIAARVNQRMANGMIGHRSGSFKELMSNVQSNIKPLFGTDNNVAVLSSSGTSALETAMVNLVHSSEDIVIISSGAFGDRFKAIAEVYPFNVHVFEVPWGEATNLEEFEQFLNSLENVKVVFSQACETSTGVVHPLTEIGEIVKTYNSEALFVVDGVSAVGGMNFDMPASHIDCLITGSQKAMMLPPGLAFVALNDEARAKARDNEVPRFYLDINKYFDALDDDSTPFTPAVSLIQGLDEVLEMFKEEGYDNIYKKHTLMRDMLRAGLQALDIELLVDDQFASPTVTSFKAPAEELSAIKYSLENNYNITIAGGQKHLKGKILRIGHMGYMFPKDMLTVLSALEHILTKLRDTNYNGKALSAAQEVYYHGI